MKSEHIQVIDDIPEHILDVENLIIYQGDLEPQYSIELIPEQTFGEKGEPYLTNVKQSIVDSYGRVIILNVASNYENSLYVYDSDGTYHTKIGGPGRGPGEFGFVFDVKTRNGEVIVRDVTNQRINLYSTDGYTFTRALLIEQLQIRNHNTVDGMQLGLIMPRQDGNYLVSFSQGTIDTEHKYLLMDNNGNKLDFDTIVFPNSPNIRIPNKPIAPSLGLGQIMGQTLTALSNEGALYSIWTNDFLIKKYDSEGIYTSAIYYPVKGLSFDINEFTQNTPFGYSAQDIKKGINNADLELPETFPVLDNLMIDDEYRIWAAVPMDGQRVNYDWWILDETGKLLARLRRPQEKEIFDIKNGFLYAKEIDEESGAEFVVKYRMEWTEK